MNPAKPQAKDASVPAVTPESVRTLQRRVKAFAATGTINNSPVTYHR
ncbi:hypothetical protein QMK19_28460 [Streptomyces sp. H10-C2]|nr:MULTISPECIES: hypothetical protein [unclassified Streptomyces]MDJ0344028.1 hypothetical protein [Streptomyces sp. PH10-H1]MDJ0373481.1 hypothetical protein [Streptomyces sp. H10-C2]